MLCQWDIPKKMFWLVMRFELCIPALNDLGRIQLHRRRVTLHRITDFAGNFVDNGTTDSVDNWIRHRTFIRRKAEFVRQFLFDRWKFDQCRFGVGQTQRFRTEDRDRGVHRGRIDPGHREDRRCCIGIGTSRR